MTKSRGHYGVISQRRSQVTINPNYQLVNNLCCNDDNPQIFYDSLQFENRGLAKLFSKTTASFPCANPTVKWHLLKTPLLILSQAPPTPNLLRPFRKQLSRFLTSRPNTDAPTHAETPNGTRPGAPRMPPFRKVEQSPSDLSALIGAKEALAQVRRRLRSSGMPSVFASRLGEDGGRRVLNWRRRFCDWHNLNLIGGNRTSVAENSRCFGVTEMSCFWVEL